jgi:hypothetical protein
MCGGPYQQLELSHGRKNTPLRYHGRLTVIAAASWIRSVARPTDRSTSEFAAWRRTCSESAPVTRASSSATARGAKFRNRSSVSSNSWGGGKPRPRAESWVTRRSAERQPLACVNACRTPPAPTAATSRGQALRPRMGWSATDRASPRARGSIRCRLPSVRGAHT